LNTTKKLQAIKWIVVLLFFALPVFSFAVDTDGDGVIDEKDNYPSDAAKVVDFPAAISDVLTDSVLWLSAHPDAVEIDGSSDVETWYDWSGNQQHFFEDSANGATLPAFSYNSTTGHYGIDFSNDSLKRSSAILTGTDASYSVIIYAEYSTAGVFLLFKM
jgi:hypothetical protein